MKSSGTPLDDGPACPERSRRIPIEPGITRVEGTASASSTARVRRLRKMLRDLMRDYMAASAANPTKAHHLVDAVIDLCVMIQRTENEHRSTGREEEPRELPR